MNASGPFSLVHLPAFFHIAPNARFPAGRAGLDHPLEVLDPARKGVLVDGERSRLCIARTGAEKDRDAGGGMFPEAGALAGLGAPLEDDEAEDIGEVGVADDGGDGRDGPRGVDLVWATEEAQDGRQVDRKERRELRAETGAGREEFEGGTAQGPSLGHDLSVAESQRRQRRIAESK